MYHGTVETVPEGGWCHICFAQLQQQHNYEMFQHALIGNAQLEDITARAYDFRVCLTDRQNRPTKKKEKLHVAHAVCGAPH